MRMCVRSMCEQKSAGKPIFAGCSVQRTQSYAAQFLWRPRDVRSVCVKIRERKRERGEYMLRLLLRLLRRAHFSRSRAKRECNSTSCTMHTYIYLSALMKNIMFSTIFCFCANHKNRVKTQHRQYKPCQISSPTV